MNKDKVWGNLAMLLCSILFAINIPVSKIVLNNLLDPLGLGILRLAFASAGFWIVSFFFPKEKVDLKDFPKLILGAFLGMFFNQITFIVGLAKTSPVDAAIIGTSTPLITMLLAAIFIKEPITPQKAGGVFLGALGALIIIMQNSEGNDAGHLWGNILCFVSAISYAFYLTFSTSFIKKYTPITVMKWMFLFGTLMGLPFTYDSLISSPLFTSYQVTVNDYLLIFYILFGATFVTYLLIPFSQKRIRPTTISSYNYVQPMVASIIAIILGQDLFRWDKLLAGLLIMIGVYFVTTSKSKADLENSNAANKEE